MVASSVRFRNKETDSAEGLSVVQESVLEQTEGKKMSSHPKYCPKCGHKEVEINYLGPRYRCSNCGWTSFEVREIGWGYYSPDGQAYHYSNDGKTPLCNSKLDVSYGYHKSATPETNVFICKKCLKKLAPVEVMKNGKNSRS